MVRLFWPRKEQRTESNYLKYYLCDYRLSIRKALSDYVQNYLKLGIVHLPVYFSTFVFNDMLMTKYEKLADFCSLVV